MICACMFITTRELMMCLSYEYEAIICNLAVSRELGKRAGHPSVWFTARIAGALGIDGFYEYIFRLCVLVLIKVGAALYFRKK